MVAIFGDDCTNGLLYSVGRLPDRATDWVAYKKPKVQKMTEITGLFEPYKSVKFDKYPNDKKWHSAIG